MMIVNNGSSARAPNSQSANCAMQLLRVTLDAGWFNAG